MDFVPNPKQVKYAEVLLSSITENLTDEEIAKRTGVVRKTIWNWKKNPEFVAWLNSKKKAIVDATIEAAVLPVLETAIRKAKNGHYLFAKMILEMAGLYQQGMKIDTGGVERVRIEVVQAVAVKNNKELTSDTVSQVEVVNAEDNPEYNSKMPKLSQNQGEEAR